MKKIIALVIVLLFSSHAMAQAATTASNPSPATAPDVSKTVEIGTAVDIKFISADGTGPFTYQWLKDGNAITGVTANSVLSIKPTTQNSAGAYQVLVFNSAGVAISNKVNLSISITIAPTNAKAGF
jgi:beta-galactosidase